MIRPPRYWGASNMDVAGSDPSKPNRPLKEAVMDCSPEVSGTPCSLGMICHTQVHEPPGPNSQGRSSSVQAPPSPGVANEPNVKPAEQLPLLDLSVIGSSVVLVIV